MTGESKNRIKIEARDTTDGAGAQIKRVFPGNNIRHIDPFVLLDEFFVTSEASFPEHFHSGFEAITYMLEGSFRHKDNLGNDSTVNTGGIQCFSAGEGIRHAELPGSENMNHGLQLWINLPDNKKNTDPTYQKVESEDVSEQEMEDVKIRTLVGQDGLIELNTDISYRDFTLEQNSVYEEKIHEDWNGILYVLENKLKCGGISLFPAEGMVIKKGGQLEIQTEEKARFVLITGAPHNKPIKQHGSVVD